MGGPEDVVAERYFTPPTNAEYIVLNCERCGQPVVKIHRELKRRIYEALRYRADEHPHFYHPNCQGGYEE